MKNALYETSLTDAQWAYLKPMLPKPAKRGRPPTDFPPWKTVYHIFRQWTLNHQWAALNDVLRTLVRRTHDKRSRPTAAILDRQSGSKAASGICSWKLWGWCSAGP